MKENIGFFIFIFFIVVFIILLIGDRIVRSIKMAKLKAKKTADEKAQKYRDETGRQQRQYYYNANTSTTNQANTQTTQEEKPKEEEPVEIRTKTATGETIIDRRGKERESKKKIYEDAEGEYVEFSEEVL